MSCCYRYVKVLVQELSLQLDKGFILSLLDIFSGQQPPQKEVGSVASKPMCMGSHLRTRYSTVFCCVLRILISLMCVLCFQSVQLLADLAVAHRSLRDVAAVQVAYFSYLIWWITIKV